MRHILVFRFSAMGDVALVAPALFGVVQAYPDVIITVVTRPKFAVFFENMPRIEVVKADIDTTYKGVTGLYKLYKFLSKNNAKYDAIIDLHDNLRTKLLRFYFKMGSFFTINKRRIFVFNKGRTEKKKFIKHELDAPLLHTTARYAEAFAQAGFPFALPQTPVFQFLTENNEKSSVFNVGIAPFAKHATKELPFSTISELILLLIEHYPTVEITLFGGGQSEVEKLNALCEFFPNNTVLAAGKYSLQAEIQLMQTLDAMVCMDSSNMHLAALAGVKTVSIWGATHSDAGFSAYGFGHKKVEISREDLTCRPCSIFGDKPCVRGDHACMQRIEAKTIFDAIRVE